MSVELRTERLLLRPSARDDIDALLSVAQSSDRRHITALLQQSAKSWHKYQFGVCVALIPASQTLMGWCGARPDSVPEAPELFYGVAQEWRGRGLATEMSRAMVAFLLSLPAVRSVWAAATADHSASIRVMRKAGLVFERSALIDGKDSVIYRLSRASEAALRSLPR